MKPNTITWKWEDGKELTVTLDQFELITEFAADREKLYRLMRFLAELPGKPTDDNNPL